MPYPNERVTTSKKVFFFSTSLADYENKTNKNLDFFHCGYMNLFLEIFRYRSK